MFKPVVRRLIVKRFRSFPSERIELDNPTFLVGRNDSGKSNLVDAFSLLAEAMSAFGTLSQAQGIELGVLAPAEWLVQR